MTESTIQAADGTDLNLRAFGDDGQDLLIVIGQGEYGQRYDYVANKLVESGLRVHVLTLRGHSGSGGKPGHIGRWTDYWDDVYAAAKAIERPLVLLGHSMGGLVCLGAVANGFPTKLRGVMTTNPMIIVKMPVPRWKEIAAKVLSRLAPTLLIPLELDPKGTSHDPAIVDGYASDTRIQTSMSTRWGAEVTAEMLRIPSVAPRFHAPLLMLLSAGDPIIDAAGGRAFADRVAGPKQVIEYGPMLHELLNEVEKDKVIADIVQWVQALDVTA